jgi:adenylate kinase
MPLRDLFRRRRRDRRRARDEEGGLTEEDVQRLQRVQRAAPSAVKVVRREYET